MITTTPQDPTLVDGISTERRIGKSQYWLQISGDTLGSVPAHRLGIFHKPSRTSKNRPPLGIVQFSPLNPLFTIEFDGQRYPLMIGEVLSSRRRKIKISGARNIGPNQSIPVSWSAELTALETEGTAQIRIDAKFHIASKSKKAKGIRVLIPIAAYQPDVIESPCPTVSHVTSAAVWIRRSETAVALYVSAPSTDGFHWVHNALQADIVSKSAVRTVIPLCLTIALRPAKSEAEALELARHVVAERASPSIADISDIGAMTHTAREGINQMLDSKSCTTIGKERWYFHASGAYEYGPGYPYFTIEAAPALLRWNKFYQSEIAVRAANLTARGVAADFAVIVGTTGVEGNKGAFWDCASGSPGALIFSTFKGRKEYGIASNARIALALFQMFTTSRDPLFRQSALNTCHWLLLKQNSASYFDGPYISAKNGKYTEQRVTFDGILAIRTFVAAFQATGQEVFVRAAVKIAVYLRTILLPNDEAPCLYGIPSQGNCPVALSQAIVSLFDLDGESENKEVRHSISVVSDWLGVCRFDADEHACLDYDGAGSGYLECANAALRLFNFTAKPRWFAIAHSLTAQVAARPTLNWRLADASSQLLASLGTFVKGVKVDIPNMTVTYNWGKYLPDSAATQYLEVRDGDQNAVDYLPLICQETQQTLLFVVAPKTAKGVHLIKRNLATNHRIPMTDLVKKVRCGMELPLHNLPTGSHVYGVVQIDP